jgi:hypothetical protein
MNYKDIIKYDVGIETSPTLLYNKQKMKVVKTIIVGSCKP